MVVRFRAPSGATPQTSSVTIDSEQLGAIRHNAVASAAPQLPAAALLRVYAADVFVWENGVACLGDQPKGRCSSRIEFMVRRIFTERAVGKTRVMPQLTLVWVMIRTRGVRHFPGSLIGYILDRHYVAAGCWGVHMPVDCTMENGALVLRLKGDYDFEELTASVTAAFADPCFRPGTALLIDERASTVIPG